MPAPTMVTYQGETRSVSEWALSWGVSRHALGYRIRAHGQDAAMRATDPSQPEQIRVGRKAINIGGCSAGECDRPAHCRGVCKRHYRHLHYAEHERARRGHKPANYYPVGATRINGGGYVEEKTGPRKADWMLQHRWVMEQILGRKLFRDETVHHKNGIKTDNRPENLELWASVHPRGQRVEDLLEFAHTVIDRYGAVA